MTSGITLCFGHSVGMHRKLIHESFDCPLWLERICVYLGTLVGMAGPFGMIRLHDFRDWAQRQPECHDYSQAQCVVLARCLVADPLPACARSIRREFRLEPRLEDDTFYEFVERTWMAQQVPLGSVFYRDRRLGVAWYGAICVRVAVCVTGHWLIGHYAHRQGPQTG